MPKQAMPNPPVQNSANEVENIQSDQATSLPVIDILPVMIPSDSGLKVAPKRLNNRRTLVMP